MKPNTLFFIEFLFFDVVALAWGAWELWSVRPSQTKPEEGEPSHDVSLERPGHPEG